MDKSNDDLGLHLSEIRSMRLSTLTRFAYFAGVRIFSTRLSRRR